MAVTHGCLPAPGSRIGAFVLGEVLGSGGCGAVYAAHDARLRREVAVKVLVTTGRGNDETFARRFLREIDLTRRLEHRNIVRLYDAGETECGLLWMAIERVRGAELREVLAREGRLSPQRARRIMLQVLSALAEAHAMGIVHRDLKPSNIMLAQQGADDDVVKLLDFGVGKALGAHEDRDLQEVTHFVRLPIGTPRYMAPEILMREPQGPYTDVYAAGLLLAEMLQGEPVIGACGQYEALAAQLAGALPFATSVRESALWPVIERATRHDWRARFCDALAMHQALAATDVTADDAGAAAPPTTVALPAPALLAPMPRRNVPAAVDDPVTDALPPTRRRARALVAVGTLVLGAAVALSGAGTGLVGGHLTEAARRGAHASTAAAGAHAPGSQTVRWLLDSRPGGASVHLGERLLCRATPCHVELTRSRQVLELRFERHGHVPRVERMVPRDHGAIVLLLPTMTSNATMPSR